MGGEVSARFGWQMGDPRFRGGAAFWNKDEIFSVDRRNVHAEGRTKNEQLILQLHDFKVTHYRGPIGDPSIKPYGNGILLWFEIDAALERIENSLQK